MLKKLLLLFLLLILAAYPAGAVEEINQDHIKMFDIPAPNGLSITQIGICNLDPTSQTNLTFNAYGKYYLLSVNSTKNWGWWDFDVTLTDPEGTITSKHLSNLAPLATDYDLYCQYYFLDSDTVFDLDVYTTLRPLNATLAVPPVPDTSIMQWSNVSCTSSSFFDATLTLTTPEEFHAQQNNSYSEQITTAVSDVFEWSWSAILTFVGKIPLVGGHISAVLILTTMTLSSIIFYTRLLFIDYSETTFLSIEFFILTYSLSKRGSFWTKIKRAVDCHVKIIELTLDVAQAAVNLFTSIVNAITSIIQALKPI